MKSIVICVVNSTDGSPTGIQRWQNYLDDVFSVIVGATGKQLICVMHGPEDWPGWQYASWFFELDENDTGWLKATLTECRQKHEIYEMSYFEGETLPL